ncbi:MAG: phosphatidate cytidylyltransferase [Chlamydiota bacterium]
MASSKKDYKKRFVSSSLSIVLIVALFMLAPYPFFKPLFAAITAAIASVGIVEFARLLRGKQIFLNYKFLILLTFAFCFLVLIAAHFTYLRSYLLLSIPISFIALFFTTFKNPKGSLDHIAYSILLLVYLALPMGLMVDMVYGIAIPEGSVTGLFWLAYLIIVAKSTDMLALFTGRAWGQKKLCPHVSPNKTVVGAIGGVVGASFVSIVIAWATPLFLNKTFISLEMALLLGIIIGCVAEVGDLLESLFKRDAKIDESSNILPGLGGILDVLDSLLLTTPVVWAAMRILS